MGENKYKVLIANLSQKIFYKDRNSVYVSCNESYAYDLKIKPYEIVGKTDYDFYNKELAEKYRADDKRILESGKTEEIEEKYIQDGQEVIVHTAKAPIKDEKGSVIGILGIFWDITESKRIEEALRESEEKYRALFEATPMGIGIADLKGNIFDGNQSMQEMTGFTLEELRTIGVGALYVDPNERKSLLKTLQETGRVYDWEVRLKRKDGTIYYALLNVDLLELKGHKVLLTTARDITERKRMEEELRKREHFLSNVFASIQDGIGIIDKDMNIIRVNPTAERWYPHAASLVGRKCYEAYHGRSERCKICPAQRTFKTGEAIIRLFTKADPGGRIMAGLRYIVSLWSIHQQDR